MEPEVESLPILGRTWYARGRSYWFRRALFTLFCLGIVALYVGIIGSVLLASSGLSAQEDRIVKAVLLLLVVGAGVAEGVWLWRRRPGLSKPPSRGVIAGGVGAAAIVLILARAGVGLAGVLFFFVAIFTSGLVAVMFLKSLTPVLYGERQARASLEPWFRERGRAAPWNAG
jgi:hypothetical protein